ncbi:MAG: STAS domain-containing protein [Candidatus Omnitrophica bacterium]|jgi:anti-sigma B factor antagonist|nr:STAS domain-containing protein [Candidatus Omnitrophota bacterium]MDD5655485.1 STAS domain-containing protein [Candidatus Omnitrophota bacterium]
MQVKQSERDGVVIFLIEGEVNIDTVADLKEMFKELVRSNRRKVLLDFGALEYIDSSGLASLIDLAKGLKTIQGNVFLANLSPKVRSLFGITKLEKMFKIYDTQEQAMQDFYG